MENSVLSIIYLLASVSYILGLKMLSHPQSARKGNQLAAFGMTLAIFGTIFLYRDGEVGGLANLPWIFAALFIGAVLGWWSAKKVQMTAMPEMVSLFNGMGGACALLISVAEFHHLIAHAQTVSQNAAGITGLYFEPLVKVSTNTMLIMVAGLIIGGISFSGSLIAWGKLNGKVKDIHFAGQTYINLALLLLVLGYATFIVISMPDALNTFSYQQIAFFYFLVPLALVYGVLFVLPIGGADMPVVISLLNSFTGVAAACGGFLYHNKAMLTGGILVGAAGTLLTILMCKAMNRSLLNVLIGSFGVQPKGAAQSITGAVKEVSLSDAAVVLSYAQKVMFVPGYGLAVAQAQHACNELEKLLEDKGVQVTYAIHPVAGRMPGHMNVLLAESDVPYEKLIEMEQANDEFATCDAVLILGANDVVNPAAKTDPASPIFGMPILEVEKSKMVIVNKRSMKPGYAGIENQLFFQHKTSMLFGDAKKVLQDLVTEIKAM